MRSFLIVPLLKDHLRKPRSCPHMNLIIMRLVLVSRWWNSARCNRAVLIGFIYKTLFRSGILLVLRHVTIFMDIHGYLHCIRIHIREILRLRIYPWILSMKKSRIHIRKSMDISMDISIFAYPWRALVLTGPCMLNDALACAGSGQRRRLRLMCLSDCATCQLALG